MLGNVNMLRQGEEEVPDAMNGAFNQVEEEKGEGRVKSPDSSHTYTRARRQNKNSTTHGD